MNYGQIYVHVGLQYFFIPKFNVNNKPYKELEFQCGKLLFNLNCLVFNCTTRCGILKSS